MAELKEKKYPVVNLPENVPVDFNFERMLKTFMKQVDKSGVLKEVKARRYHIKPSEQKRLDRKRTKKY
jgi:ribosomal protein S21